MKRTDLARQLNGCERPMSKELCARAARAGLVVLAGPFARFCGAIEGEATLMDDNGDSTGGEVYFDAQGILPSYEDIDTTDEAEARAFFDRKRLAAKVEVHCHTEGQYRWTYSTTIPNSTFTMLDEGAPYCRGIVFSLHDAGLHVDE
jgi:hypothetical protein